MGVATMTASPHHVALPLLSPMEENVPSLCSEGENASIPLVFEIIAHFVSHYCWDSDETLIFTVQTTFPFPYDALFTCSLIGKF